MKIQLKTIDTSGKTKMIDAKPGVTINQVQEIMENEVTCGFAVYAAVIVDGKVYAELEVLDERKVHRNLRETGLDDP